MFIYKGGNQVTRGTYWDPETREKIVMKEEGLLPGTSRETYFKLPESYLLIPIFLIGLGLSMAFPYGVGFVCFIVLIALSGALYAAGSASIRLFKELFGRTATFGYAPTTAYMTGKKTRKAARDSGSDEKKKDA
ncbi:MAG TPA: hypothetical protein VK448_01005 [Dissulfurispiraceae bacterium]|nr:hypothetical protein [Dissulfurispiraceae bacterium]